MVRRSRPRTATCLALLALATGSGCSGSADDMTGSGAGPSESSSATARDATPSAEACAEPGETVTVAIPDFAYAPDPVVIERCDAVVWVNDHAQAHTSTGNGDQLWVTGGLAPGDRSDPVPFGTAGTFTYFCSFHPFMTGTVEVR